MVALGVRDKTQRASHQDEINTTIAWLHIEKVITMSGLHEVKNRKAWTCPHCTRVCNNGWHRHRHTQRDCELERERNVVEEEASNAEEAHTETELGDLGGNTNGVPLYIRQPLDHDDIAFANAMEGSDDVFVLKEEVRAELPPLIVKEENGGQMQQYTQTRARSCPINPKDMEILLFLQCTDAGNGASQAQKNAMLQYVKGFDTARTRLLPRWIPTCHRRMEKVMSHYVTHKIYVTILSYTLHTPVCALH